MHPNEALITRLYTCFQAHDAAGMKECYHPDAVFSDPVFGRLEGEQVTAMWAMLCARAADLEIDFSGVRADDVSGQAHWDARYTFSQSGRKVLNQIDANFAFRDGLIARHDDRFSFRRWSKQALGPVGLLLGWTPLLRARVGSTARKGLASYMRKQAERQG
jgi:ketosteroid isomerase-like protein